MNTIIAYMSRDTIQAIANNLNSCANTNVHTIKTSIEYIVTKLKERCSYIINHIRIDELDFRDSKHLFAEEDNLVIYYGESSNSYHIGKWKNFTLLNDKSHKNSLKCGTAFQLAEYLNNHINKTKSNKYENRLQETDDTCGERDVAKGTAIEVKRGRAAIESGSISYGTIIGRERKRT